MVAVLSRAVVMRCEDPKTQRRYGRSLGGGFYLIIKINDLAEHLAVVEESSSRSTLYDCHRGTEFKGGE